jgi:hypothetical protein
MYLAYLDDSRDENQSDLAMVGAILIPDTRFQLIEAHAGLVVEGLIPEDKLETFAEFHAVDLYGGHNAFKGLDEGERMLAIRKLLDVVAALKLTFIYSAVDEKAFAKTAFGGGSALDTAFRMCLRGIELHLEIADNDALCLPIMDDTKDGALKHRLRSSFKAMRKRARPPSWTEQVLGHFHDDMYFGDSTDSLGIQLADLCSYFVARRIKRLSDPDGFYDIFQKGVVCSKVEPEWSQFKGIFLEP